MRLPHILLIFISIPAFAGNLCWRLEQPTTVKGIGKKTDGTYMSVLYIHKNKTRMEAKGGFSVWDGKKGFACGNGRCQSIAPTNFVGAMGAGQIGGGLETKVTQLSITPMNRRKKIAGQTCTYYKTKQRSFTKLHMPPNPFARNEHNGVDSKSVTQATTCNTLGAGYKEFVKHMQPLLGSLPMYAPAAKASLRRLMNTGLPLEYTSRTRTTRGKEKENWVFQVRTKSIRRVPCKMDIFKHPPDYAEMPTMPQMGGGSAKMGYQSACDCNELQRELKRADKLPNHPIVCMCINHCKKKKRFAKVLAASKSKVSCDGKRNSASLPEDDYPSPNNKQMQDAINDAAKSFLPF